LRKLFPKEYSIFPQTWVLPADQGDLLAYMRGKKRAAFICKPQSGCQGKGIFLTRRPTKKMLKSSERYIVQQYISRKRLAIFDIFSKMDFQKKSFFSKISFQKDAVF